jgi:3-dehydroquinate dehydratase
MGTPSDQLSTEQIISAVTHLSLPELEQVFDQVLQLKAERKADHLSAEESALLIQVSRSVPAELRERLATLRAKREDDSITDAEYEELSLLNDKAEEAHADRMAALVELAKVRGVSLPALMDQLGIHLPENV